MMRTVVDTREMGIEEMGVYLQGETSTRKEYVSIRFWGADFTLRMRRDQFEELFQKMSDARR